MNALPKTDHTATEAVFQQLYAVGAITGVVVVFEMDGRRCSIQYSFKDRESGWVQTKRGDVKLYRLDTAMAFLRSIGCWSCRIDLVNFDENDVNQRKLKLISREAALRV
jgi:hypothetical protein